LKRAIPTGFAAVFRTEVLFNLKRVAPYVLMIIFIANATLWWGWGPAIERGWAVNSDFYIVRLFGGFSFLTLPLFISLMMGDPVIRDFRIGVDPLIFSKPVGRIEYLLGKFFGNFFVLVCCQACFALTLLALQAFRTPGMIVLPPRLLPYFQHFFFFVVVSSLGLAAFCFTVGTLTRNVKVVYGLALSSYFLYSAWQFAIKGLPLRWRIALDPLLLYFSGISFYAGRSSDWLNQVTVSYDGYMIINRVLVVVASLVCLAILYARFSIVERDRSAAHTGQASIFNLAPRAERLYSEAGGFPRADVAEPAYSASGRHVTIPQVSAVTSGMRAGLGQFAAVLGVEFRLLRAERSLVVVAPLVTLLCGVELAAFEMVPEVSYSATYASRIANVLLLFLFGISVFYVGETMHRDRECGIEPVLWSAPAPDLVILGAKLAATLLLSISLIALAALTAIGLQIYRGHAPLDIQIYVMTCSVILIPSAVFMTAASVALNSILREKYVTYAVSLAVGGGFYYLAGQGYTGWLSNPILYRLWTPSDLAAGGSNLTRILVHRIYCFALSSLLFSLALIFFERKSTGGLKTRSRLSGARRAILSAAVSALIALVTGLIINARA
jgi:hypothetical protein